jgi:hypothetical protein
MNSECDSLLDGIDKLLMQTEKLQLGTAQLTAEKSELGKELLKCAQQNSSLLKLKDQEIQEARDRINLLQE